MGNLLARLCAVDKRQVVPIFNKKEVQFYEYSNELIRKLKKLPTVYEEHFESYNFYMAVDKIFEALFLTNNFIQETKPWVLVKNPANELKLESVLALSFESLRINAILLQPIIPNLANKILDKLNVSPDRRSWKDTKYQLDTEHSERPLGAGSSRLMDRIKF